MRPIVVVLLAAGLSILQPTTSFAHGSNKGTGDAARPGMNGQTMMGQDMKGQKVMGRGMMATGLMMPSMDPARGRQLFAGKGCVVCHSVNGVGGEDAPPLDASTMSLPMNPFEFAARMWRGAEAMVAIQREELGDRIELTGEELADIIAFVHDADEQKRFSQANIPPRITELMEHLHGEEHPHDADEPAD